MRNWKIFVYAGFFLALAVMFQGLRLIFPMVPGPVQMFLVGSLVNMCLVLAVWVTRSSWAGLIGIFLPLVAFFQGALPVVLMVPVIGAGNVLYAVLANRLQDSRLLWLVPCVKTAVLYIGACIVIQVLVLPAKAAAVLAFMMSWPQIVTGLLGIGFAKLLRRRVQGLSANV